MTRRKKKGARKRPLSPQARAKKIRAQAAARQRARRDRKRLEDVCSRCNAPRRPGVNPQTGEPFTTCAACNANAMAAVQAARAAKKKQPKPAPSTGQKTRIS